MKKNDILELSIIKYAFEGKGIAKIHRETNPPAEIKEENFVVFVQGAYPGDVVKAKIRKVKKNYAEAQLLEVLVASDKRIKPECKYFGVCGGCKQQDLDYKFQTEYKYLQVEEIFRKLGGLTDFTMELILQSDKKYFYRNKMEFSFADKRWLTNEEISSEIKIENDFALGLHIPGLYDKVLDINECLLQSEVSNGILNLTRDFFKSRNLSIYTTKTHTGYLRNLIVKQSSHSNDLMVNIVTSTYDKELIKEYSENLLNNFPTITTIVNNISAKKALIALGDYEEVVFGDGYIHDTIGSFKFRISANSFFQTNTLQAEKLYNTALEFAGLNQDEIVYDLYSGTGTISIFISKSAKKVYGFEVVDSSVHDANVNKEINGISNVEFYQADLYKTFLPIVEVNKIPKPDVVIVDPPRSGMHTNTISDVITLSPRKIVYVSCNPTTQVRDINLFVKSGYKLVRVKPVDMFPQTHHVENVAELIKE